jgi:hypothetical protein
VSCCLQVLQNIDSNGSDSWCSKGEGGRCRTGCSLVCRAGFSPTDDGYGRRSVWRWLGSGDDGTDRRAAPVTVEVVLAMVTAATGQAGGRRRRAGERRLRWVGIGDGGGWAAAAGGGGWVASGGLRRRWAGGGGWHESMKIVSADRAQAAMRALRYSANLRRSKTDCRRLWLIYVGLYPVVIS